MRRKPRPGVAPGVPPQCHLHQPFLCSPRGWQRPPAVPARRPSSLRPPTGVGQPSAPSCPCPGPSALWLPPTAPPAPGHHPRCPAMPPDLSCPESPGLAPPTSGRRHGAGVWVPAARDSSPRRFAGFRSAQEPRWSPLRPAEFALRRSIKKNLEYFHSNYSSRSVWF